MDIKFYKALSTASTVIGILSDIIGSVAESKVNKEETKEIVYECLKEKEEEE